MRSSSFALFGAVGVLLVSASGCRIEAHTQTQFEDSTQPAKTSTKAWNGEAITIQNDGINPLGGTGGVEVKFDPAATKITATAIFAAHADDDKKADADASIKDAIGTFTLDESNGFTIKCGHGGSHGTSNVAGSGCKILRVTLPTGSATQGLSLTVGNGNGPINFGLANAGSVPFVKSLNLDNNSLVGEVNVRLHPVKDATIVITGEDVVNVALPSDFSSQKVTLTVNESDAAKAAARIITTDFPGLVNNGAYPVNGATTDAATSINIQSKDVFDKTLTLTKF
jgi:hypothetical protein